MEHAIGLFNPWQMVMTGSSRQAQVDRPILLCKAMSTRAKQLTALQALSAKSNAPECHIGHADRFRQKSDGEFGTGLFRHRGSVGPQGISTKPSLPSYSLGASTRDQMYKVSPANTAAQFCNEGHGFF